jgi:hypothetical protein
VSVPVPVHSGIGNGKPPQPQRYIIDFLRSYDKGRQALMGSQPVRRVKRPRADDSMAIHVDDITMGGVAPVYATCSGWVADGTEKST